MCILTNVSDARRVSDVLSITEIADLSRRFISTGLSSALGQTPSVRSVDATEWPSNFNCANWHLLLPTPAEGSVLEICAGCDTVTHALSLAYRRVFALEPTAERVKLMQRKFAEERLGNVHVIQGRPGALPLGRRSI